MPEAPTSQQLHASNISTNIGEALEARVKDPLWFLARQWQTGEFEAENGGRPVQMAVTSRDYRFQSVTLGAERRTLDCADPLEAIIEAEVDGASPAWNAEALEYGFQLQALGHTFSAAEYDGRALDWWHFDFAGTAAATPPGPQTQRVAPTQLYFRGAPHPRWWRMEEGDAYFDSPEDPEPNALSMLLPEFFYTDIDNWYTVPMPVRAGTLREITDVTLVDSFGIATTVPPAAGNAGDDAWALFALDPVEASTAKALDGRYLLVPNVAIDILQNAELEEVRFIRDEDANLVWAWERRIIDADGTAVMTSGEMVGGASDAAADDGLPRFVLKSPTARSWIPYVPRSTARTLTAANRIHLRRGRTDERATAASPQYRSTVVAESIRIFEETVPPTGIRVRRLARYARGSDGKAHFWVGRQREAGQRTARPGLRFDYLDD